MEDLKMEVLSVTHHSGHGNDSREKASMLHDSSELSILRFL